MAIPEITTIPPGSNVIALPVEFKAPPEPSIHPLDRLLQKARKGGVSEPKPDAPVEDQLVWILSKTG